MLDGKPLGAFLHSVLFFLATFPVAAQISNGTLRGVLTDSSGAIVPAASVTLTGPAAGGSPARTATTQADGSYSFASLTPGEYAVRVELPGFTAFQRAVTIEEGRTIQLPIRLTLEESKQEITVAGDAGPQVNLDPNSSATGRVVAGADLDALPDDPDDLATMLTALAGPSAGPSAGGSATILLDGFSGAQLPPKESIKEVRIDQNPFSAQYDNLGFGRIEIITKPGADKLRGSIQLLDSDAYFNSRNPYAANKADYVNRMWTAMLSGPIGKRVSYSLNFFPSTINNTALIDAVKLDPATLTPVPVQSTVVTPQNNLNGSAKLDTQLSTNNTLTGRYQRSFNTKENNGIGQYSLTSREYGSEFARDDVQLTETFVMNPTTATETRFAFSRNANYQYGNNTDPSIQVVGSFNGGGAQVGNAYNLSRQFEFQSNTSKLHGAHTIKFGIRARYYSVDDNSPNNFGGMFSFFGVSNAPVLDANNQAVPGQTAPISSLEQYRRTLLFTGLGYSGAQIQALGGGASQFSIAGGKPLASISQADVEPYFLDDWRVRPNVTLSMGLRYETQTNISRSHDFGPRLAVAWSPHAKQGTQPKTVLRVGAGRFFNRVPPFFTQQAAHFNGVNQQQYVVTNPDFYPNIPSLDALQAQRQPLTTWRLDSRERSMDLSVIAVTVERQLGKGTTISGNYLHVIFHHTSMNINLNTPLPGTFIPGQPDSGARPYGNAAGNLFTYEPEGDFVENVAWVTVNHKLNQKVSLGVNYQHLNARGDTSDTPWPSNPYNLRQDYGRISWARPQNFNLYGTLMAPLKVQFNPNVVMASGAPYDLTTGSDFYGTTIANARPAFATDLSRPSVVVTRFGAFDTNPMPGQTIVPRNYLTATGMWNINMRVGRTFQIGRLKPVPNGAKANGDRRYNINFNVEVNNIFNHLNQGGFVGNLSSPLFGQSTSIYLFRDTSNNRRVQFGTQFNF
ncbi:MAG TPA: carboxypeptidase regulatory-like domain-containing protein [Bryobacteraceae bacterium]|nr:carboxypeptidase regulatory-like domain-containing protein [Bryobacteraceae bacterium]